MIPDCEILNCIHEDFIHALVQALDSETDDMICMHIAKILRRILSVESRSAIGGYIDALKE